MPNDTITLVLRGPVFLEDFSAAVEAWQGIIYGLGKEVAGASNVKWEIEELSAGSFLGVIKAVYRHDEPEPVYEVVRRFTRLGRELRSGRIGSGYSNAVRESAQSLTNLIGERVKAVRFETDEDDAEITHKIEIFNRNAPAIDEPIAEESFKIEAKDTIRHTYGSIRGRVQSISDRKSLKFTLYDANSDRAITCYVLPGNEELMRDAWGKLALVEGIVRRDPITGHPTTVRNVNKITTLTPKPRGSWRAAMGCAPARPGEISPEAAIRRLRDAE